MDSPQEADTRVVVRRCVQFAVDTALLGLLLLLAVVVSFFLILLGLRLGGPPWLLYGLILVIVVGGFGISLWLDVWSPLRNDGSTPAMRLLGLRITRLDGTPPSLGAYLVRWLLRAVDGLLFNLVGLVAMLLSPRNQRIGDLVAGTVVVRRQPT